MPDPVVVGPFEAESLTSLVRDVLTSAGAGAGEAQIVAAHLVDAEARESRSQGLVRVASYVAAARSGKTAANAPFTVESDSGATLVVDAHNGWGHPAALRAMDLCVDRAAETGACFAIIRNTGHIGRLGAYCEHAASRGAIGLIAAGGNPSAAWVAPWGGMTPLFGTNPFAIGFPRCDGPPVVVDISTTQGARGNVLLAQKTGHALPPGWAFDKDGEPTTDPNRALPPHGTLAPLGGHKGYALALAVEILCGVLSGVWPPKTSANFVAAIRVDAFLPRETYERSLEGLLAEVKGGRLRPGFDEILLPGEGSARRLARSAARGVEVPAEMWAEIVAIARDLGVEHPLVAGA